jgi:hypothetical protein
MLPYQKSELPRGDQSAQWENFPGPVSENKFPNCRIEKHERSELQGSGIRKKLTILRSFVIMDVEKNKKGLLKRPFLLVPVQFLGYFLFFFITFGA